MASLPYAGVDSSLRALAGRAEGFGRFAIGGLNGPIYCVTTLAGPLLFRFQTLCIFVKLRVLYVFCSLFETLIVSLSIQFVFMKLRISALQTGLVVQILPKFLLRIWYCLYTISCRTLSFGIRIMKLLTCGFKFSIRFVARFVNYLFPNSQMRVWLVLMLFYAII